MVKLLIRHSVKKIHNSDWTWIMINNLSENIILNITFCEYSVFIDRIRLKGKANNKILYFYFGNY